MNDLSLTRFASISSLLFAALLAACSSTPPVSDAATNAPNPGPDEPPDDAGRAIAEADIVQLSDGKLYAMSQTGGLAVVDVSAPGRLALLGKTALAGYPFEMYRRGNLLVTMSNAAFDASGELLPPAASEDDAFGRYEDQDAGAAVIVLDVARPAKMSVVATFAVPGQIADSRVVGDILYLVTHEGGSCFGCVGVSRTLVTSFDLSDAAHLREIDRLEFVSNAEGWPDFWNRSVVATAERLYVGSVSEHYYPWGPTEASDTQGEGAIDVVDITNPDGKLRPIAHVRVPGMITSRWQMDEHDGVLRVVSQRGAGRGGDGTAMPSIDTFLIGDEGGYTPLGHADLRLPIQEGLKAVRFDRDRAYAITFRNTDPLFVLDLRDPAAPQQRGELVMPGYVFHMEPRGDRLLGLGLDTNDADGHLNVSLFDVSDLDNPRMLSRVPFGNTDWASEVSITEDELPEDQSRIQKAFRVLDDGTIVVPYSAPNGDARADDACDTVAGGVQLVEWRGDALTKRALLPTRGSPRRAFENGPELVTVSDSNVRAFSRADRDTAVTTADVEIGTCERRYRYSPARTDSIYPDNYACATGRALGGRSGLGALGLAGLVGLAALSRRRSRPARA
jgi:hypothetical protein